MAVSIDSEMGLSRSGGSGSSYHRLDVKSLRTEIIRLPNIWYWCARGGLAQDPAATSADCAHSSSASPARGADSPLGFRDLPLVHRVVDESRFHLPARP